MKTTLSDVNRELHDLYKLHWKSLQDGVEAFGNVKNRISFPLLVKASPEYEKASPRLLIVGQQTSGWDNSGKPFKDDPVLELMSGYEEFGLGKWYRPTPFFQTAYVLQMTLNPSGPAFGFAWTNLVKVDQEAMRPTKEVEDLVCGTFPVVADEIRVLSPDVVVFFTGPYYDARLMKTFPRAKLSPVGVDCDQVWRVEHDGLPKLSFRTYHPGYLARTPVYGSVIRRLVSCCLGAG